MFVYIISIRYKMIKYIKLKSKKDTSPKDFETEGVFKADKIYIGKIVGPITVIVYDENKNGIYYNLPSPCGFGRMYILVTNNFDKLKGHFFSKNKKELREVINVQSFNNKFKSFLLED